jgi:hypothetical protein
MTAIVGSMLSPATKRRAAARAVRDREDQQQADDWQIAKENKAFVISP